MNLRQAPNQSKGRRLCKRRIKKMYEDMKNRVRCDGQNGYCILSIFDKATDNLNFYVNGGNISVIFTGIRIRVIG